jgi:hypothetical protein
MTGGRISTPSEREIRIILPAAAAHFAGPRFPPVRIRKRGHDLISQKSRYRGTRLNRIPAITFFFKL